MSSGIYRIDLGNDWFYIGSAVNLHRRKNEHHKRLKNIEHENRMMQNCFNKYGVFKFTILEERATEDLIACEQKYLDKHFDDKNNVNLAPTAGSCLGVVHSPETRAKMSKAKKNMSAKTRAKISAAVKLRPPRSAETRAKLSASQKGKVILPQTRAKMSAAQKGRVHSAETRAKMSEAGKRKVFSTEHRANLSKTTKLYWAARKAQAA